MYLGLIPIQLSNTTRSNISIPIVSTATEKTGSPTIGLKKVLSKIKPSRPVKMIPMINANMNGIPICVAK